MSHVMRINFQNVLHVSDMLNKMLLLMCLQEYGRGCVTLVGDAAHVGPVNGQGLNLTMEDAAVLGFHLREGGLTSESLRW
jgi:2-polyprenyl-6-methoxyphenol hydroxylase-like FAD-dependent oxidoreductase